MTHFIEETSYSMEIRGMHFVVLTTKHTVFEYEKCEFLSNPRKISSAIGISWTMNVVETNTAEKENVKHDVLVSTLHRAHVHNVTTAVDLLNTRSSNVLWYAIQIEWKWIYFWIAIY